MSAVALQSFGFGDQLVRVVERANGVWFVGKDVCAALEIVNDRNPMGRLDDDEKDVHTVDTPGGPQQVTIISESGVYALIFTSRKAVAVTFRKWVTGEVLPALRRTGRYEIGANDDEEEDDGAIGIDVPHLGSIADRDRIKTAVSVVRMYERNWGPAAARAMAVKLGFPMLDIDLPAAPAPVAAVPAADVVAQQQEGDVVQWGQQVKLEASRRDATHHSELFASYTRWCSVYRCKPIHPDRFIAMMKALFGTEEHPEMYRCVMRRV